MRKIIYGWLFFLSMPLTILGYSKLVDVLHPSFTVDVIITIFGIAVLGFQFVITCGLVVTGWNQIGEKTPFD